MGIIIYPKKGEFFLTKNSLYMFTLLCLSRGSFKRIVPVKNFFWLFYFMSMEIWELTFIELSNILKRYLSPNPQQVGWAQMTTLSQNRDSILSSISKLQNSNLSLSQIDCQIHPKGETISKKGHNMLILGIFYIEQDYLKFFT